MFLYPIKNNNSSTNPMYLDQTVRETEGRGQNAAFSMWFIIHKSHFCDQINTSSQPDVSLPSTTIPSEIGLRWRWIDPNEFNIRSINVCKGGEEEPNRPHSSPYNQQEHYHIKIQILPSGYWKLPTRLEVLFSQKHPSILLRRYFGVEAKEWIEFICIRVQVVKF